MPIRSTVIYSAGCTRCLLRVDRSIDNSMCRLHERTFNAVDMEEIAHNSFPTWCRMRTREIDNESRPQIFKTHIEAGNTLVFRIQQAPYDTRNTYGF